MELAKGLPPEKFVANLRPRDYFGRKIMMSKPGNSSRDAVPILIIIIFYY
jgi:hypothetical protein